MRFALCVPVSSVARNTLNHRGHWGAPSKFHRGRAVKQKASPDFAGLAKDDNLALAKSGWLFVLILILLVVVRRIRPFVSLVSRTRLSLGWGWLSGSRLGSRSRLAARFLPGSRRRGWPIFILALRRFLSSVRRTRWLLWPDARSLLRPGFGPHIRIASRLFRSRLRPVCRRRARSRLF